MSAADAEAFLESQALEQADTDARAAAYNAQFARDDIVVFVDYHEDRARNDTSFVAALRTAEVKRATAKIVQCRLHTGDVVICRVEAHGGDDDEEMRASIDTNIRLDANRPASSDLREPHSTQLAAILVYERKTVTDLVSSIRSASSVARENHLQSEITRQLEFCRQTGARPRLLLEGYLTYGVQRRPVGSMNEEGLHSLVQRLDLVDGVATVQTVDVRDSARTCLKDARFIGEKQVAARGWLRLGTGEARSQVISVRKADNYDVQSWYRGTVQAIPGMSSDKARLVVARYPNIRTLLAAFDACDDAAHRQQLIANLRVESGQRRRIGPAVAARVVERFYAEPIDDAARPPKREAAAKRRRTKA